MTIAISLSDSAAIESYDGLQAFLIEHLELSASIQTQLPTLIRLAEMRLSRLLETPDAETTATAVTVAGTQTVALPDDFKKMRQLRIGDGGTTGYPLPLVAMDVVEAYDSAGKPVVYAIHGSNMVLAPIPDAVYSLSLRYTQKLTPLSDSAQSNWLLSSYADAYVYMSSAVICEHRGDPEMATLYLSLADGVIYEINAEGVRHNTSGPMCPVVVGTP